MNPPKCTEPDCGHEVVWELTKHNEPQGKFFCDMHKPAEMELQYGFRKRPKPQKIPGMDLLK